MTPNDPVSQAVQTVVQSNTAFALDLYAALGNAPGNLFFSPHSIATSLAMTYAGAVGATADEMARMLHVDLPPAQYHAAWGALAAELARVQAAGQVQLGEANALWPQTGYPFLAAFLTTLQLYYGSTLTPVDYSNVEAARQVINAWVEEQTQVRIQALIPPGLLTPLTRLVLTNAIYFKGQWAVPFDPARTLPTPFRVTAEEQVSVPMMAMKQKLGYAEVAGLQVLELPYAGQELAMVIVLPRQVDGLAAVEATLTPATLAQWLGLLEQIEVQVLMPRFSVSQGIRLDKALQTLGMVEAFDAKRANLAGMDGNPGWLYVEAALHKAFVEVNEEGTEAAAASAVVIAARSMPRPVPTMRVDHPFLFLIRARRTGSILFLGRVENPEQSEV